MDVFGLIFQAVNQFKLCVFAFVYYKRFDNLRLQMSTSGEHPLRDAVVFLRFNCVMSFAMHVAILYTIKLRKRCDVVTHKTIIHTHFECEIESKNAGNTMTLGIRHSIFAKVCCIYLKFPLRLARKCT